MLIEWLWRLYEIWCLTFVSYLYVKDITDIQNTRQRNQNIKRLNLKFIVMVTYKHTLKVMNNTNYFAEKENWASRRTRCQWHRCGSYIVTYTNQWNKAKTFPWHRLYSGSIHFRLYSNYVFVLKINTLYEN